ncbi:hypothetical protein K3N28_06195 [Glycomyces sp. TRM65418]|nr:hypothetical protein [Glycomyces sp. TRM65418]
MKWNSSGRLETVTNGENTTRFYDDAEGNRLVRKDPDGSITAWVAGYELHYNAAANTKQAIRYYTHAGTVIAQRTGLGAILFVASDHHGTGQWIVNGNTLTATVRRHDPFGNTRGLTQGTWPDDRGFVGGIDNTTVGLTTLGAREYDPTTGRFVSVDPIADYTNPQQLNGYAYANNDPINMIDATGLCMTGPGDTYYYPGECTSSGGGGSEPSGGPSSDPVASATSGGGTVYGEQYSSDEGGCVYVMQGAVGVPCDMWEGDLQDLVDEVEEYLYDVGDVVDPVTGMYDPVTLSRAVTDLCFGGDYYASVVDNCQMDYLEVLDDQRMAIDQAWTAEAAERNNLVGALIADLSGGPLQAGSAGFTAPWMTGSIGLQSFFRNKNFLKSCKSFEAGTLVVMPDGSTKPIEQIMTGESVLAADPTTGDIGAATVSATHTTLEQPRSLVTIGIDTNHDGEPDADITATAGHAFWAAEREARHGISALPGWITAENLTEGAWLQAAANSQVQVVSTQQDIEVTTTYNLSVANAHTYFVAAGDVDILTHNCGGSGSGHSASCTCTPAGSLPSILRGTNPRSTNNGKGTTYDINPSAYGFDSRVVSMRVMSSTSRYPNGYVVFMNKSGQTVNPLTGRTTTGKADPWGHIPLYPGG